MIGTTLKQLGTMYNKIMNITTRFVSLKQQITNGQSMTVSPWVAYRDRHNSFDKAVKLHNK